MNECELVKKILNHINADDYKTLINKVWFRGFWVPGIANQRSDKKWRPKVGFINNDIVLSKKIRKGGKHNYELLMDAMVKMAEDRNDKTDLLYNAVRWINDPDSHQKIEEYFNQLENKQKNNVENHSEENKKTTENNNVDISDDSLTKENKQLKAEIDILKNRGKKYKENIQDLKIKCSNLEQENNRVKKENNRRKSVFINTKSTIQYIVKSMMSDYKSDKFFTGYLNSFENEQEFDDEYCSEDERIENFWDHTYNKLFIYNFKSSNGDCERMTRVHLVNKPAKFNENEYFKGVPVFSQMKS